MVKEAFANVIQNFFHQNKSGYKSYNFFNHFREISVAETTAETVVANYRFGTWNIGTLKGKSGEVCKVLRRRKVKVCCIQEVRWKG